MARITWDDVGSRLYEAGVDRVVLYPTLFSVVEDGVTFATYTDGVPWNGVISVTESPSGAEATPLYADNIKYLNLTSNEEFAGSIEAYTYPDEFAECIGRKELCPGISFGQQKRKTFGLSYRTRIGNDTNGTDHGYKIHLVYGALASVSEKGYGSVNESPEAMTHSFEFTTTAMEALPDILFDHHIFNKMGVVTHFAHVEIDSTKMDPEALKEVETALYEGYDDENEHMGPSLPSPYQLAMCQFYGAEATSYTLPKLNRT